MLYTGKTVWVIGASSGIGRELAVELSKIGAKLILSARREDELKKLQSEIGTHHEILPLDVADYEQLNNASNKITEKLDSIIYMAALYKPDSISSMDINFASKIIDVNIKGALYVTHVALKIFEKQKYGQIVLCGSVAGYIGLPNGQPYSATKAAMINFAESLRAESPNYIDVKLISPGFVETQLTAKNTFKMPMILTTEKAVKYIIKGLQTNKFEIHFPKIFTLMLKFLEIMPYKIQFFLTKKLK